MSPNSPPAHSYGPAVPALQGDSTHGPEASEPAAHRRWRQKDGAQTGRCVYMYCPGILQDAFDIWQTDLPSTVDFGMAQHLSPGDHAASFRGSPLYMVCARQIKVTIGQFHLRRTTIKAVLPHPHTGS